jgi:bifunctional DNA-binding transcriptional regulator/antitoxin component of YhaV-PrlF toxin-antitoxin module
LSRDGKLVLPAEVRRMANWSGEQRLVAVPIGTTIVLTPAVKPSELRGIAKGADTTNVRDRRP